MGLRTIGYPPVGVPMHEALARIVSAAALLLAGCGAAPVSPEVRPPVARAVPHRLEKHGHVRTDDYFWLRDRKSPEVLAHLEAENAYTQAAMAPTEPLQEELFREIRGRIKQADETVPYRDGGYYYLARTLEGKDYPVHARRKGSADGPEEILVDGNALAQGHGFLSVRGPVVSPGQDLAAYGVDTVGRRFYTLRFKDLKTGAHLRDAIPEVTGDVAWANDNRTLFYGKQDPVTLRSHRIYRHVLGTDPAGDVLVFEEKDETFRAGVRKSRSKKYILISSTQTQSSETRILSADEPAGEFRVFLPREKDHLYDLNHSGDTFWVRSNRGAPNYRLLSTPVDRLGREHWKELVPHRDDVFLQGVTAFTRHLVVQERKEGLVRFRVLSLADGAWHDLDFAEPAFAAFPESNAEVESGVFRYGYSSLTTPDSVYDYDLAARRKTLLKRDEVKGYDPAGYVTDRLWAPARDGRRVPVSIAYRRGTPRDGSRPLLLYGYGSYGASQSASWSAERVSLLDRGWVYAIAHVRGGQELGRPWYEEGRLLRKLNTFTDFIDGARHLVSEGYTRPDRLFAMGGSAGGLLMGAVMNLEPGLFRGIIARVPFVDVVTTMLDDTIPLTTNEYDEWGNPNDRAFYDYMLSYSPYDRIEAKAYPELLVTTGLHDSQVQYWEPAKWVAKLRATKTDRNLLLFKVDMEAGHGGASGRTKRYRETAFLWAFLLRPGR